jgi:hypothetical protein
MNQAINRAHDLRIPFCHLQYRDDGTISVITPYYMDKFNAMKPGQAIQ